ncbi:hypothetical protein PYW08_008241 [Mythimna loreyi]|uniref:Uncharacterized protein n=1 Tax=Mythimna loreyi TaxID=667449 RepID=A0ACC2QBB8_9NEOP|nr:hypothetical protein PYW08_008241 [Mythimna loreyi]
MYTSLRQEKVDVLPEPIKSDADKKLYKTIRLQNGLTALLISDPTRPSVGNETSSSEEETSGSDETTDPESESGQSGHSAASDHHGTKRRGEYDEEKLAACALCIGVGSYSDPAEIQGLAHFVEHMVFMGSEKYPKENEFDSFIKKKGGSDNASTDCEVTTFYFEIQEKYLPKAMDMFSQFFVSPLMNKEAMQREREAIESEFAIASPSDSNRKDQLLSSLFPEGHPARTFTWGNLRSLKDDINDDEKLHLAAHAFRKRHYSAHRMTVAVQARMDLSALEEYVVNTFGHIPTNKLPSEDFSQYSFRPETVTPAFKSIYYVKPVGDTTEVTLTWCMRSLLSEYESKPHQYISYLLGHEGKGSLLSYLRKRVWALGIYTGNSESGIDYTSMYSLFSTQVVLTKDGLDHIDEVLEAIFSYINMLKQIGPSERIFNEIKTIEETSFRFEEESQPAEYVESLAENMHFYPPQHYITGDRLYYKYDPKGITELLDCMRADAVNIIILSNKHSTPIKYDSKEKWFGTEYKKMAIPGKWLDRWLNVKPYDNFFLPEKNVYITTDFSLVQPDPVYIDTAHELEIDLKGSPKDIHKRVEAANKDTTKILEHDDLIATVNHFRLDQPNLLRKNRHMELWYKPDFKFRFPTALLYFYFISPLSLKSPRDSCLLDLWTDVLQQGLKEEVYPANMADLSHSLYVGDKGLTMKVTGYSQNLHLLVELITREMRSSTQNLTSAMFEAVREVRARSYHNVLIKPHKLAKDVRMNILLMPYISPREKAAIIHNITLTELQQYSKRLLSKMYCQILMQGNLPWYRAIRIAENVHATLKWDALTEEEFPDVKVHQLPLGERKIRVLSLNEASTNSIITNYYQAEASTPKDTATLEVLMHHHQLLPGRGQHAQGHRHARSAHGKNEASTNSVITNYYQAEASTPKDTATLEVLMHHHQLLPGRGQHAQGHRHARSAHGKNEASTNSIITNYYQAEASTPKDTATLEVLMHHHQLLPGRGQHAQGHRHARSAHGKNEASTNSIITNYYQAEASTPKDTATLEVLMAEASTPKDTATLEVLMRHHQLLPGRGQHAQGHRHARSAHGKNEASTNSVITNYYQAEASTPKDTATLEVLMLLMEEPVFDNLRTKEQLGYSVFSMMRYTFGVLGFSITVNTQVDKFSVSYVDVRMEEFLKKFSRDIRRLTEKTLSITKQSLVQLKHTTDYELKEEVERNWREIISREYMFHRLFLEAAAIEKIRLSDIKSWVDDHFSTGNRSKFRKVSIQIMGHKSTNGTSPSNNAKKHYELTYLDASQPIGDTIENNADFIHNISAFKEDLPFINIPKVHLGQC